MARTAPPQVLRGLDTGTSTVATSSGPGSRPTSTTRTTGRDFVGYALACLSLAAAGLLRWRLRAYFVLVALIGVTIAVGVYPYSSPSPFGRVVRDFARSSQAGMALRSTARAVPLVVMGLAVLLAVGIDAGVRWVDAHRPGRVALARVAVFGAGFLVLFNFPAIWNGTYYGKNLQRPELVPSYWSEAAAYLDARPHDTRVMALPGADFASYYWGNTVDPILPGMMDRPFVARELIPYGSPASANLLNAFDRRMQEGAGDPVSFAPMARLMSVGDLLLRNDVETARYNLIRPQPFWRLFHPDAPPAWAAPHVGADLVPAENSPSSTSRRSSSSRHRSRPRWSRSPSSRHERSCGPGPSSGAITVAGDGAGIVNAAEVGLVGGEAPIFYSAAAARIRRHCGAR